MKRIFAALAIAAVLVAGGCSKNDGASDTLTGAASDVLQSVLDTTGQKLGNDMPVSELSPVDNSTSQQMLGLSAADFDALVSEASVATALIMTSAQETALVKVKDAAEAKNVAQKIAAGFNSKKWICVMPEKSVVVTSGSYILLAVGKAQTVDALVQAFSDQAKGNTGEANTFFTKP